MSLIKESNVVRFITDDNSVFDSRAEAAEYVLRHKLASILGLEVRSTFIGALVRHRAALLIALAEYEHDLNS